MLLFVCPLHPLPINVSLYTSGCITSLLYVELLVFFLYLCLHLMMPFSLKKWCIPFACTPFKYILFFLLTLFYRYIILYAFLMPLPGPSLTIAFQWMLAFPDAPSFFFLLSFFLYPSISLFVPLNFSTYTPLYTWTLCFYQLSLSGSSTIQIMLKLFQLLWYFTVRHFFILELFCIFFFRSYQGLKDFSL